MLRPNEAFQLSGVNMRTPGFGVGVKVVLSTSVERQRTEYRFYTAVRGQLMKRGYRSNKFYYN
jgi:hypothetical protein